MCVIQLFDLLRIQVHGAGGQLSVVDAHGDVVVLVVDVVRVDLHLAFDAGHNNGRGGLQHDWIGLEIVLWG